MRICMVWLLVALAALAGTAQSQEIVDLYSGIDSSDVTIDGDVAGYTLRLDLISDGKVILTTEPEARRSWDLDRPVVTQ